MIVLNFFNEIINAYLKEILNHKIIKIIKIAKIQFKL